MELNNITRSPERRWDHLYIPEEDLVAYWVRRSNDTLWRCSKSEMRRAAGMDAVWITLIMLVGFAAYRIVGG